MWSILRPAPVMVARVFNCASKSTSTLTQSGTKTLFDIATSRHFYTRPTSRPSLLQLCKSPYSSNGKLAHTRTISTTTNALLASKSRSTKRSRPAPIDTSTVKPYQPPSEAHDKAISKTSNNIPQPLNDPFFDDVPTKQEIIRDDWGKAPAWVQKQAERGVLSDIQRPPEMRVVSIFEEDIPGSQRLLKPFLFTSLIIALSLAYAYTYTPPTTRLLPSIPMALATIGGIVAINVGVYVAWHIPFCWRFLNTYFLTVPAIPGTIGLLGCAFSHQGFTHLLMNMAGLFLLGTTVCNEIGRGNFLALYCSAAAFSSFASLTFNVLIKRFEVYCLGASGAVYGIVGAYGYLFPDAQLWFLLLPQFTISAKVLVLGLGSWELTCMIMAWWYAVDHMAHLSGLIFGTVFMRTLERVAKEKRGRLREEMMKRYGR